MHAGGHEAFSHLSFYLRAGEMAFVTGHSGAGKSTLLKLLSVVERPSRGQIVINGQSLAKIHCRKVAQLRRRIGMVFQDHRLLMDRNVFANVELPLIIAGMIPAERRHRVRAALEKVGLLDNEKQRPEALSFGEQQRIGIARAIVGCPRLLIADEPTGNLDPNMAIQIMQLFAGFRHAGTTVLIASHDLALIKRIRQRVIVLDHGRLVADVAAGEVQ